MNYKAITTLKKTDTEGRIPPHTLDQYVRTELAQQLMNALKPALLIDRSDQAAPSVNQPTVDFTTELFILKFHQWQQLKDSLSMLLDALPNEQHLIRQIMDEIEMTPFKLASSQ